jgi:hypothetical protein
MTGILVLAHSPIQRAYPLLDIQIPVADLFGF